MAEIALVGATSVLRQTVVMLGNLVVDEGSRLSRLREGILWIESEIGHIQSYLEDADAKQRQNRKITRLVIDIRDLAYDVEDIIDNYFSRITSHRRKGFFSRLKSAFCILRSYFDFDIPIGIWKMRQLRHLILSGFTNAKVQQIDVSLPNLQSLHLKPMLATSYLEDLRFNNLTSLRKLYIKTDKYLSSPNLNLSPLDLLPLNLPRCENLYKLSLGVYMKNLPDLDKLPPNLTKLILECTELEGSPLETLKKLPKLKILKLGEWSYIGRQIICSGGPDNFPQLETLEIHDLTWLEELIAEEGAMPRLKKLSIVRCSGLTVIPDRFRSITTTTA
ncbi:hypothetical protein Acr_11g0006440 [Actinidia rufa]|uniref:Rx N-terminal domain-containing protein n=1 Tax=Actinidia rufa TaxID=165716 RepID=A0A7J0FCF4_9ERIC|nr:hypothetical protein Acr_11g0006440 [Actinidia rufa]